MRLVVATPLYPPEIGGPATYAKLLAEGLPARGVEVEVVKFADVRHLPKLIRHYVYYRRVLRAARRADIVLALDPVSVGLPAMRAAKKAGKPFVMKVVGDYAWEQGSQRFGITATLDEFVKEKKVPMRVRMLRDAQTRVARAASRVIVPSLYLKGIIESWSIPGDKIEVIYNAVPLETMGAIPSAAAALPRPLIVTAGRLVPWKNMEGVIDAIALLRRGYEGQAPLRVSLAIAGDGPDRVKLEAYAKEKLEGAYVFAGALLHADMLALMQSGDGFVLNSTYEGLSHFLIEAGMLGVPTVATNVGGNPEILTDGENGVLVPSEDTRSLADSLARILADGQLASRLSSGAKESAARFSEEAMLAKTEALLTSLV
jgi:glycosyltransferase involved in cell wall biosynthesis